jgi:iron-only hydrogenase group A
MDFQIEVNGRFIDVQEGETLLTALRRNGLKIPTLCHMNRFSPTGACRLCVVEIAGKRDLITSCSHPVEQGMKVYTNSPRVIKSRKALVELLLSNHPDDCLYCQRNGNCELQWLAEEMNIKERKYFGKKNADFPDHTSTSVMRDPAKCILCSRCVRICEETQLVTAIDFISRANNTRVNSAFEQGLNVPSCINCGQCITVCPTAALQDISHLEKVQAALENKNKEVIFMLAPSAMASVAEHFGFKAEKTWPGVLASALRKCGAKLIYDAGQASDLNVLEEARLIADSVRAKKSSPRFSSCCPAWVNYVEVFRPEWSHGLLSVKSPQQLLGQMIKSGFTGEMTIKPEAAFCVSVVACTANKYEASREEMTQKGISHVDAVLTVREILRLFRTYGLDLGRIESAGFDAPYDVSSAAAWKMAYSGGKAEAVAYECFQLLKTSSSEVFKYNVPKNIAGRKETRIQAGEHNPGFAWVSGIAEADAYIGQLIASGRSDIHYVEVMACPGGCAGGGGQPVNRHPDKVKNRKRFCQEMEKICELKWSSLHSESILMQRNNQE